MTETELFKAIHTYADEVESQAFDGHNDDPEARAKLLEAIREWVFSDMRRAAAEAMLNSAADKIALLYAKAAVCDAYLAIVEGTARNIGELREMNGKLVVARENLRDLQAKDRPR